MNPDYRPGSIVGVQGGLLARAQHIIFEPQTNLYHFLVIRARLAEEDDYEIIEMGGHGCDIGRLSWYEHRYYVVYFPTDPQAIDQGKRSAKYCSIFGRKLYNFGLFLALPADLIGCWFWQLVCEHRLCRIRPDELALVQKSRFVCTRLAQAIWQMVGIDVIPPEYTAIPPAFVKAEESGRLQIIDIHYPLKRIKVKNPQRILTPCKT